MRTKTNTLHILNELKNKGITIKDAVNRSDCIKIHVESPKDFRQTTNHFDTNKIPYQTYQLAEEKLLKVVIRGIPEDIDPKEVLEELERLNCPAISATRMKSRPNRKAIPPHIRKQRSLHDTNATSHRAVSNSLGHITPHSVPNPKTPQRNARTAVMRTQPAVEDAQQPPNDNNLDTTNHNNRDPLQHHNTTQYKPRNMNLSYSQAASQTKPLPPPLDRQHGPGGGTAIIIKRQLRNYETHIQQLTNLEATSIELQAPNTRLLRLTAVYNPPDKDILTSDLDNILDGSTTTIVAGDLNAKHKNWHCRVGNNRGRDLNHYVNNHRLQVIGPAEYTHYPNNGNLPDILDIAIFQEKVEAFADSIEQQFSPTYDRAKLDHIELVHRRIRRKLNEPTTGTIQYATPKEVKNILKRLNSKKAPGPDAISNHAIKLLPRKGILALTTIINAALPYIRLINLKSAASPPVQQLPLTADVPAIFPDYYSQGLSFHVSSCLELTLCAVLFSQNMFVKALNKPLETTVASLRVCHLLTKKKKPFADGNLIKESFLTAADSLFSDFKNKKDIIDQIKDLQLSRSTVTRRIEKLSEDIICQWKEDGNICVAFSLQFDESTDRRLFRLENDDNDKELLLHTNVRWLIRSRFLMRFLELPEDVKSFLSERGDSYPQLTNSC
ncbi:hypothetical protein CBL_05063 [Carabus blaptoides fortunei]